MLYLILLAGDRPLPSQDKLIFFSYILTFLSITLFNTVDVTLFDFRTNTLNWVILSAIWGITSQGLVANRSPITPQKGGKIKPGN